MRYVWRREQVRKGGEVGWLAQALLQLAIAWSHATADQASGGCFPTGRVAAEGHGWVVLSSPCVHWPSSLPRTPPPELVTGQHGQHATPGQLPLLESKQRKTITCFTRTQQTPNVRKANSKRCKWVLDGVTAARQIPQITRATATNVCVSVCEG